jgi:hypothetical protein
MIMPELEQRILRVEIDGTWTSEEFSDSLRSIGDIYSLRTILRIEERSLHEMDMLHPEFLDFPFPFRRLPKQLREAYRARGLRFPPTLSPLIDPRDPSAALKLLEPDEQLYVKRIQFGSPGFTDLAGVGEVVGHIKDFLLKIIDLVVTRQQRDMENEERKARVQKLRIENARELVGLAKDCGYSPAEIRQLVHWVDGRQAKLLPFAEQDKIRGAHLLSGEDEKKG